MHVAQNTGKNKTMIYTDPTINASCNTRHVKWEKLHGFTDTSNSGEKVTLLLFSVQGRSLERMRCVPAAPVVRIPPASQHERARPPALRAGKATLHVLRHKIICTSFGRLGC